jgi:hypothetical protein
MNNNLHPEKGDGSLLYKCGKLLLIDKSLTLRWIEYENEKTHIAEPLLIEKKEKSL